MSKYTEKDKNEVIIRYESGQTMALISKETGISRGTIYSWLKQSKKEILKPITILITKLLMRQKTIITKGISLTDHLN